MPSPATPIPSASPSPEQVRDLPLVLQAVVPPESGDDVTGHAGVGYLQALHARAKSHHLGSLGLDEATIAATRRNVFDLEHYVTYLDEVLTGDAMSAYVRVVGHSAKVVHGLSFLVDDTRGSVASTCEFTCAFVDLDTRRTTPLAGPLLERLDAVVERDGRLDWAAPLCGAMGLR